MAYLNYKCKVSFVCFCLSLSSANIFLSFSVGQAFLTLSPLQISSLTVISGRLWVGTGGGAIFSIPLSISEFYADQEYWYFNFILLEMYLSSINYVNDCPQHQRRFLSHIALLRQPSCVTMDIDKLSDSSLLHLVMSCLRKILKSAFACCIYLSVTL